MDAQTVWERQLKDIGADLQGHFRLTTGRHSSRFFMLARISERPHILQAWCRQLYGLVSHLGVGTFVGAALGGILPAYAMAEVAGGRALFANKMPDGTMQLYPGALSPGEPVMVIEDAVATGSSIRKVIRAIEEQQGHVAAIGAFVDRGTPLAWGMPFYAVMRLAEPVPMWDAEQCPLCQKGVPLTRPKT
ncbi:MAG: orotate phosphoribosyltransferase [Thermaerobacter sp.]|nr:orotate phosphoribosyltransferase [Thermaerobacter sp.]